MRLFIVLSALDFYDAQLVVRIKRQDCDLTLFYPEIPNTVYKPSSHEPWFENSENKYHKRNLPKLLQNFKIMGLSGKSSKDGSKTIKCMVIHRRFRSRLIEFARFTGRLPYTPARTQRGKSNQICRLIMHKYVAVKAYLMDLRNKQSPMSLL